MLMPWMLKRWAISRPLGAVLVFSLVTYVTGIIIFG